MESLLILAVIAAVGLLFLIGMWQSGKKSTTEPERMQEGSVSSSSRSGEPGRATRLLELASELYDFYREAAHPSDLLENPQFEESVRFVNDSGFSDRDLLDYFTGENAVVACVALEALSRRTSCELLDAILDGINGVGYWTRYFALRCLERRYPEGRTALLGPLLDRLGQSWNNPSILPFLKAFVERRLEAGEQPSFGKELDRMSDEQAEFLAHFIPQLRVEGIAALESELREWQRKRVDVEFLDSLGRVRQSEQEPDNGRVIEHEPLLELVDRAEQTLLSPTPRSILLVGESGVGKSALARVLCRRLQGRGWTIFEAGHTELLAGMIYIGQFEERLQKLARQLGEKRRILWIIPDFHRLETTGRHQHGPSSALDYLLPFIEAGEITVVGETTPTAHERLIQTKPRCRTGLELYRLSPLDERATLDLARRSMGGMRLEDGTPLVAEPTLQEAWNLTRQYLWSKASPGNLLQFLSLTAKRLLVGQRATSRPMSVDDLIVTLSQLTGLPESILDEREELDLAGLRDLFRERVMGQTEAVDCLVEQVAMIKAGVTDPSRPQGVFMFAGPTGTGKTEIAKTLTEFLFGVPERMIRLDMSEFQDPSSLDRVFGDAQNPRGDSLVELIRNEPFSVVLLDEFEKADPTVWNLFLQVFDDGRLTDRGGRTADFRHAIIILTSNLGSVIRGGGGVGFMDSTGKFSGATVHRALQDTFSREFLNRLDRTVVFRPLSREVMRSILMRELDNVFERRGLRNRAWAVEWDDSAVEFLLEKGFTPDLGARPLKRSIERYFLAPLAVTIVNHQFPEGDQFLFVRHGDSGLAVEFIDPEGSADSGDEPTGSETDVERRLEEIIFAPRADPAEIRRLEAHFDRLRDQVEADGVRQAKQAALARTAAPEFWGSADRFEVLGRAEFLDRIESGVASVGSLMERLRRLADRPRAQFPRDLVGHLAQKIHMLEIACRDVRGDRPSDAFVVVEAGHEPGEGAAASNEFAGRLATMYRRWAEKREVGVEVLETVAQRGAPYRCVLAFSGFGAYSILEPEDGLHIFELVREEGRRQRRRVARVRVVPQPAEPAGRGEDGLARQAEHSLSGIPGVAPGIVRRYRERPSPLVRDAVRRWRTGHLDRVMDGDFDLIESQEPR